MAENTTASEGVQLTLADGSVIKAANSDEALKIAAKMKEDTSAELKRAREALAQSQAEQAALAARIEQATAEATRPKDGFDKTEYYRLLNEDPTKAADFLDAYRFGLQRPEDVRSYFTGMDHDLNVIKQQSVAAAFQAQHYEDYPASEATAKVMTSRVQELISAGYPLATDTLELAYGQLVSEGAIKPNEPKSEPTPEPSANPSLAGSSQIPAEEINKAEQMSDADLRAYLQSKGMLPKD